MASLVFNFQHHRLMVIFFNEDLSQQRQRLLYLARKANKLNKIEGQWTADGTILTKVKDTIKRWTSEAPLIEYLDGLPAVAKKSIPGASGGTGSPDGDPDTSLMSV